MSMIVDGQLKLTWQEFRHFPEDGNRHELIDGEHVMAPAPGTGHQSVSKHIGYQLYRQFDEAGVGQVFSAPVDVELSEIDIVEPDLLVVLRDREHIISPSRIIGPPDLVVEILSPSTASRDRELKRLLYAKSGVPVYWIVDSEAQEVSVFESMGDGSLAYPEPRRFHEQVVYERGSLRVIVDLTKVW
ncbi:MAG: Uma2 family endonuclease [Spirochaetota bacterium]